MKGLSAVRPQNHRRLLHLQETWSCQRQTVNGSLTYQRESATREPAFYTSWCRLHWPAYVRQGRSNKKRYGCLFTCLVMRAAYIEIANSLVTDDLINALRRFTNLRGNPETIHSDNGTNFKAGQREIRESLTSWNQRSIREFLRQKNSIWKFNPLTSHMGGVWERVIRSALLGEQIVSDESLRTLMTEVEGILNSRPLTAVSSHPRDLEPNTQNRLPLLRPNPNLPLDAF